MGETLVTVFHDSANYNVKHKLQRSWTLWYDNPQKKSSVTNWLANLKMIATIETIGRLLGSLQQPSQTECNSGWIKLHFFKDGVQPMWEDKENVKRRQMDTFPSQKPKRVARYFMVKGLLAIESFDDKVNDEICGIVLSPRQKQDRIALWTKNTHPSEIIEGLGRKFIKLLGIDEDFRISFQPHEESLKHSVVAGGSVQHGHSHQSGAGHGKDSSDLYTV